MCLHIARRLQGGDAATVVQADAVAFLRRGIGRTRSADNPFLLR